MSPQNPAIDPRRTALLIMDYQPAVLGGLSDHDQLLTLASGAIDLARQAGITVVYVRVAFADEDYKQVPEANKMLAGVARSRALHHQAPETQVHGRLEPQPGDIVVRKARVGASSTTDLEQQLKDLGITTLILAGSAPAASSCQPSAKHRAEEFLVPPGAHARPEHVVGHPGGAEQALVRAAVGHHLDPGRGAPALAQGPVDLEHPRGLGQEAAVGQQADHESGTSSSHF
jgi:Isochorismatase family